MEKFLELDGKAAWFFGTEKLKSKQWTLEQFYKAMKAWQDNKEMKDIKQVFWHE